MFNSSEYLHKRGITGPWSIDIKANKKFKQTIVIPAYGESQFLPNTLSSINEQIDIDFKKLLVIVVINNSLSESSDIKENNLKTYTKLIKRKDDFELID